jgi:hypothetical protein
VIRSAQTRRRTAHAGRQQAALELGLTVLAGIAALLVLRALFAAFGVSDRVLSGAVVYGLSGPLVFPLEAIPAGRRPVLGGATLADVTAAVLILAVPLFAVARSRDRTRPVR